MFTQIALNELAPKVESRKVTLVEALPAPQFSSGHLPTAINMPLDSFVKDVPSQLPDRDAEIVVYCASDTCKNSHIAAGKLDELGYTNVRVYAGGKAEWKNAGLSLEVTP